MAELGPLFILPLTGIKRMREEARVDGALISVEMVCDVGRAQGLLAIPDARVCQLAMARIWEGAPERTRQGRVDGGRFPD